MSDAKGGAGDQSNNNNKDTDGLMSKVKAALQSYREFSLKDTIADTRTRINELLTAYTPTIVQPQRSYDQYAALIKSPVYEASDYCQLHYPYLSGLSRNHAYLIVASCTAAGGVLTAKYLPRRYFLWGTASSFLLGELTTSVVNFSKTYPRT